jgi:hypothetical protein
MSSQWTPSPEDIKRAIEVLLRVKGLYDILKLASKFCDDVVQKLKDMVSEKHKILLIGGGEIGTEISIAARKLNWQVRVVVKEKPSPIVNLPYYLFALSLENESILRVEDFETKGPEVNPSAPFRYFYLPNFREEERLEDIADFIFREAPQAVVLEDMFLTPEEWNELYLRTIKLFRSHGSPNHGIKFIPSPVDEITVQGKQIYVSDIFLNKMVMKQFLTAIGLGQNLLGIRKAEIVDLERLIEEIEKEDISGTEHEKIRDALSRYSTIILKPASTSSGHGQFAISNIKELKRKIKLLDYLKYRVPNKLMIIEKFIKDPIELCVIAGKTKEGYKVLNGIFYQKYNPDEYADRGFEGQSRLMIAKSYAEDHIKKSVQHLFARTIPSIIKKILRYLPVPYLYVEFIIDPKDTNKVYINEISYRPDDAGFITLAAHKKSQFELFMESLQLFTIQSNSKKENRLDFIEPVEEWACVPLVVYERTDFPKPYMTYETDEGRIEDHFKFRFYEKVLGQNEAQYRRIIGYQWHHRLQEDRDHGERILRMHAKDLGITPELLERLVKALEKAKKRRN